MSLIEILTKCYADTRNQQKVIDLLHEKVTDGCIMSLSRRLMFNLKGPTVVQIFKTWGLRHDQREPFSHLFHAIKTLRGAMKFICGLIDISILKPVLNPRSTNIPFLKEKDYIPFLQAALLHDFPQIIINQALEVVGIDSNLEKSKDLNDGHDIYGSKMCKGVFSDFAVQIIGGHGYAKIENSKLDGYILSKTSKETMEVRKTGKVTDIDLIFRYIEDYYGKIPNETENNVVKEITSLVKSEKLKKYFKGNYIVETIDQLLDSDIIDTLIF